MSQHGSSSSKQTTTIKIAPKEASQRHSASGGADPGPGDPNAAPSVAPQLVDIPDPPTPSELVVKSGPSGQAVSIATLNETRSGTNPSSAGSKKGVSSSAGPGNGPKSVIMASLSGTGGGGGSGGGGGGGGGSGHSSRHSTSSRPPSEHSVQGSQAGPAASNPSVGGAREPTSSKPLTGPQNGGGSSVSMGSGSKSNLARHKSMSGASGAAGGASEPVSGHNRQTSSPATASMAMQADSGVVHDEDEEGEGEVEQPETPTGRPSSAKSPEGVVAPGSSPGGTSKLSTRTSAGAPPTSGLSGKMKSSSSPMSAGASDFAKSSGAGASEFGKSSGASVMLDKDSGTGGKKKKVTKFRYHKRITVRTSGKTSPSTIMEKVNKKDNKVPLTPSTIEDMDPRELMRRAGIKGTNKTHWRVRLRQTKRLTKDGKTTTQTKVAYRDSEGNKRIKTSLSPFCKGCGKKLEDCKCEDCKNEKGE